MVQWLLGGSLQVFVMHCRLQEPPLSPHKAPSQFQQACPLQTRTCSDPASQRKVRESTYRVWQIMSCWKNDSEVNFWWWLDGWILAPGQSSTCQQSRWLGSWTSPPAFHNWTKCFRIHQLFHLWCGVRPVGKYSHWNPVVSRSALWTWQWGKVTKTKWGKGESKRMICTWTQLFMWSQAALAADMAELSFRAAITAAPRFWDLSQVNLLLVSSHFQSSIN